MSDSMKDGEEIREKAASDAQERGDGSETGRDTPENKSAGRAVSARFLYVVQRGDKLWNLAAKFLGAGGRYTEIMEINGLATPKVKAGDRIYIPGTPPEAGAQTVKEADTKKVATDTMATYTVQRGDTIWAIARDQLGNYRRFEEIKTINGLMTSVVYPGQTLKLPRIRERTP